MWKKLNNYNDYEINLNTLEIRRISTNKILINNIGNHGYYRINLINHNGRKTILKHRIIAEEFLPNPNNYPCVNHIDGNKLNNNLDNLEWCNHSMNNKHALDNKLRFVPKDIKCNLTKIPQSEYNNILELNKNNTIEEISKIYNVHQATIKRIINIIQL